MCVLCACTCHVRTCINMLNYSTAITLCHQEVAFCVTFGTTHTNYITNVSLLSKPDTVYVIGNPYCMQINCNHKPSKFCYFLRFVINPQTFSEIATCTVPESYMERAQLPGLIPSLQVLSSVCSHGYQKALIAVVHPECVLLALYLHDCVKICTSIWSCIEYLRPCIVSHIHLSIDFTCMAVSM